MWPLGLRPHVPLGQLSHILGISERVGGSVVLAVRRRHRGIRWFRAMERGLEELRALG